MSWWIWYLIGAMIAIVVYFLKPIRAMEFLQSNYKVQGLATVAVLGGLVYGTVLWVVLGVIFHL